MLVTRGSRLRIGRDARGEHREVSFSVSPGQVEYQDHKDGAWSNPRRLQKNVESDDIEQDWHDQDQSQWYEAVQQEQHADEQLCAHDEWKHIAGLHERSAEGHGAFG